MVDVNHVFPSHEQEAWLPPPLVSSEGAMGTTRPVEPSTRVEVLSCSQDGDWYCVTVRIVHGEDPCLNLGTAKSITNGRVQPNRTFSKIGWLEQG